MLMMRGKRHVGQVGHGAVCGIFAVASTLPNSYLCCTACWCIFAMPQAISTTKHMRLHASTRTAYSSPREAPHMAPNTMMLLCLSPVERPKGTALIRTQHGVHSSAHTSLGCSEIASRAAPTESVLLLWFEAIAEILGFALSAPPQGFQRVWIGSVSSGDHC